MTADRDPLRPRPIDLPTAVPLDAAADLTVLDDAKVLKAPNDPADLPAWRAALHRWRREAKARYGYTGTSYELPATRWTASCWSVGLIWLWDELLYDWAGDRFTPDRLLDTYADFGGLDAVVLWHAYPVIGIDPRNQYDYYRDVPGLAELIADLHAGGVRVFLDYNPWDVGTRRPAGSDADEVAALVRDYRADGVFLDTLKAGDPPFVSRLRELGPPPALEGESRLPLAGVDDHLLSWAQWFADSDVPGVLRTRWYEQRHMLHHTRRWNRDHAEEMQSAWVNGTGMLVWESVFGSWVGWSARDRATLRAARRVQRLLGEHLIAGDWTPLADAAPEAAEGRVAGSRFDLDGSSLWALVNRGSERYAGTTLVVPDTGADDRWFDLIRGCRLHPRVESGVATVDVDIRGRGIGAVLRVAGGDPPPGLPAALKAAAADPGSDDTAFPDRPNRRVVPAPAAGPRSADALRIPAGPRSLASVIRQRESGDYGGAPYVEEWKPLPPRLHQLRTVTREVHLTAVAVDALEVSNVEFFEFVRDANYRPQQPHRCLLHWRDGAPSPGTESQPVTYVDLADARAYAAWRGARLPTEDEWQVAATEFAFGRRGPYVWNWTESEHTDGRTRFVMLKGGAGFRAEGSDWYVDGGEQPPEYRLKFLLLGGGLSRSESIGFRCAVDLPGITA